MLHHLSVAVIAGDLYGHAAELVLDIHAGGEDDAPGVYQACCHAFHVGGRCGTHSEAHGAQPRQGYGMALGGPCLDHLARCVPAGLHHALADAAAHGSLLDDLAVGELVVELGAEYITILSCHCAHWYQGLSCF